MRVHVHFVPPELHHGDQESFEQTVAADGAQGLAFAVQRKAHTFVGFAFDVTFAREAADHAHDGRWCHF